MNRGLVVTALSLALTAAGCEAPPSAKNLAETPKPHASAAPPSTAPLGPATGRHAPTHAAPVSTTDPLSISVAASLLPEPQRRLSTEFTGLEHGRYGAVASVEKQATEAGLSILAEGGNAVDAAVATAFALAVTHPSAGNLGGGGFLLIKSADVVEAIDFREDSPGKLTAEAFWKMIKEGGRGPASVGVPGTVAGLLLAHQKRGRLPLARVLLPAENLAKNGFLLGRRQALTIGWAEADLRKSPAGQRLFLPSGRVPASGQLLRNPGLAQLIALVRERGLDGFYDGPVAADLVKSLGTAGLLSLEDLKRYRAKLRRPLAFDYLGFRVVTMPPPSGGGVALTQNLLQLQALGLEKTAADSSSRLHLLAEASRRAQAERRLFVVDPDTLSAEQQDSLNERWLDPSTWLGPHPVDPLVATKSASLDPRYEASQRELEHTTHLSVVDADGNAVSCTVTLSASFGSRVVTSEYGLVLNNAVASFSSVGANTPEPGRRTISSMTPTLLFARGQGFLALGSPGGDTIPSTLTQLIVHLVVDQLNLAVATQKPRIHQGFVPDEIAMERGQPLPGEVVRALRAQGHRVTQTRVAIGDAHSAGQLDGELLSFSDAREGGLARALTDPPRSLLPAPVP